MPRLRHVPLAVAAIALSWAASAVAQSVSIEQLSAPARIPAQPTGPARGRAATPAEVPTPGGGRSDLPLREISLYKNGIGVFERGGFVTGDALIHIDFTTAQLNDVLSSLTATDLGGGTIAGLGYDNSETLNQQLANLHLNLGPDPTVAEFLNALKGHQVQVHGGGPDVTGKLLHVEVRAVPNRKTGDSTEHRFVSLVTTAGALRTVELTPLVEVRLLDLAQRVEIGTYLRILSTTHNPPLRHLTLEARGTGRREIRISYLGALPPWKSTYRVLVSRGTVPGGTARPTATLQGWAAIDNPSPNDWENVHLTLVSGAPQFSRSANVNRPEVDHGWTNITDDARTPRGQPYPRLATAGSVVSIAGAVAGVQITATKTPPAVATPPPTAPAQDYEQQATNSLAPQTTTTNLDDLFTYKLSAPITIKAGQSIEVPILQSAVDAERVSVWYARGHGPVIERAIWLRNSTELTLDTGSFTLTEDGVFAGQGQLPLIHPGERRLAPFGTDETVKVDQHEMKDPPTYITHVDIKDGDVHVHRHITKRHDFTIENTSASPRTVVLAVPESKPVTMQGPWRLETTAAETIGADPGNRLYRFEVPVAAHSTATFTMLEGHSHPIQTPLAKMSADDLDALLREAGNSPELTATLKPIIESKRHLAELDAKLKDQQQSLNEVTTEQARIRQNMAMLKGTAEEKPLSRRYTEAMIAQEDKLAALRKQQDAARQERTAAEKSLTTTLHDLRQNIKIKPETT